MAYTFRPVRGEEHKIKAANPTEGFLYFATDTKKIFMAKDGQFIPMGGNSGVYYGSRELSDAEKEDTELTTFIFTTDDIEGDQVPNVDDLILNIPDGCFYRVTFIGEDGMITTSKLTIAGSGSGGGGGGGSDTPAIKVSWKDHSPTKDFVIGDKEMIVSFSVSAANNLDNNKIEKVIISIGSNNILAEISKKYEFGEVISIDIAGSAEKLSTSGANTLRYTVIDSYGQEFKSPTSGSIDTKFFLHDLVLVSDYGTINSLIDEGVVYYPCRPTGGGTLKNRYIRLTLAPVDNPTAYVYDNSDTKVERSNIDLTIPANIGEVCEHGVYILNASLCALLDSGKTISSPVLSHQIIFYETSNNTPLIAGHVPSTKISQYDSPIITYMIIDEQSTISEVDAYLYTDGDFSTVKAELGKENIWKKTFNKTGFFQLAIQYKNQKELLPKIEVVPYEGELPVIDETNLELYLTSQGRSNSEAAKDTWTYKNIAGKFENFLWGNANGWIEDKDGNMALKLTNGAKFSLPGYSPFAQNATERGLTIELDFMLSGVLDYSKPLIHCLSKALNGEIVTGFNITGQKATLNSNIHKATTQVLDGEEDESGNINETDMALQAFTQYYNENERIHLAYVVERVPANAASSDFYFVYTYLNGVLSGIMKMDSGESFLDDRQNPSLLEIDSTFGDIFVYNIRVYRSASDSRAIINNYIADLVDIDEKIELYKVNNIFTDDGLINIKAIQDLSYQLNVPYVLFKGGSVMPKKLKDPITYTDKLEYALPLTKSDYRLMSMQMFDRHKDNEKPVFNVPLELEDDNGNKVSEFKDIKLNTSYKMKRGVQVYGQGTSSMVYPVKNLRLKFRAEEDYPVVYEGAYPIEIACFKADFMDSSASHNTGTANLVYDLLASMGLRSPAQAFQSAHKGQDGVAAYDLLTAIRGYPIVCFYTDGESDDYTYIGRYNFNIDKATPEPFGFFPQKVYTGRTVTDDEGRERKEVECVGLKTEIVKGMTVLPLDAENKEVERDIIQCWEILNNDNGSPTKFLTLDKFKQDNTLFGPGVGFKNSLKAVNDKGDKFGWMDYYEDRYPDAMVSGGAYALGDKEEDEYKNLDEDLENGIFRLACWINSTATDEVTGRTLVDSEGQPISAYYPTRDLVYNPNKKYFIKNGDIFEEKVITSSKIASIPEDNNPLGAVVSDIEVFAEKVNNVYDQYTFVYSNVEGSSIGWYLKTDYIGENLSEYGVAYTGAPEDASSIIVIFAETNDWSKTLLEEYTVDNKEYRLAKFKAELEDYMNLNFVLFYYVLTMILLMMDSRAKNMMLASWDQKIWYPIFYDMDTALGVNNTGFNKFAYDTEDDPEDKVFNGFDSVLWNNVRECFYPEICDFYSNMRTYLKIEKLLDTYNAKASDKWNEALTTADAEYKYIRPYEEGYYDGKDGIQIKPGQVSYLYAGQGKRTNHRSYWLNNRVKYFDSKYLPTTYGAIKPSLANTFSFRAYALPEQKSTAAAQTCVAQTPANHQFDVTALNNSYQSLFIGNIVYGPEYTLANQTVTLGPTQVKHEVESYILNPDLISNLGDLSDKYLGQFNFPGLETRLTELNFGRSSRSHTKYDKYYNNLLSSLNIGESCPYLQKINIARCTGLKSIDLVNCTRLKELDAEGCKLTNITFPTDSIIEKLYLPNTLTQLELVNQPHMESIVFDNLATGSASLRNIKLDKISSIDSYPILKGMMKDSAAVASKTYYLNQVNWTLNAEDDFIVENDKIIAIDILEKLQIAYPYTGYTVAQALTGTITIDVNVSVDQFQIYEKYNKTFPNVKIVYAESTPVIPAKTIRFFDNDVESEAQEFYSVYTDGTKGMRYLVSAEGPNGVALGTPAKASTDTNSFEFTGRWLLNNNPSNIYTTNENDGEYLSLYGLIPETSMDFYPQYETVERKYSVKLYD